MRSGIHWRELIVGLAAAGLVLAAAGGILVFGRVGSLHGKTFDLYAVSDGARGLIRGSEVWLDGQKVGLVRGVTFRSPSVPASQRLVIGMTILEEARPLIRLDTRLTVQSGSSIIGDQVVYLTSGTPRKRAVVNDDTLQASGQLDVEGLTSDAALASKQLPVIMSNVKLLSTQLRGVQGSLGAFGADLLGTGRSGRAAGTRGNAELRTARERINRLMLRLSAAHGTLGLALRNGPAVLQHAAARAMAEVDSVRTLLGSHRTSLGRFQRDSTIVSALAGARTELAAVQRLAADSATTLGRFRSDSAITKALAHDIAALDSLIADMKKHPIRYLPF